MNPRTCTAVTTGSYAQLSRNPVVLPLIILQQTQLRLYMEVTTGVHAHRTLHRRGVPCEISGSCRGRCK